MTRGTPAAQVAFERWGKRSPFASWKIRGESRGLRLLRPLDMEISKSRHLWRVLGSVKLSSSESGEAHLQTKMAMISPTDISEWRRCDSCWPWIAWKSFGALIQRSPFASWKTRGRVGTLDRLLRRPKEGIFCDSRFLGGGREMSWASLMTSAEPRNGGQFWWRGRYTKNEMGDGKEKRKKRNEVKSQRERKQSRIRRSGRTGRNTINRLERQQRKPCDKPAQRYHSSRSIQLS